MEGTAVERPDQMDSRPGRAVHGLLPGNVVPSERHHREAAALRRQRKGDVPGAELGSTVRSPTTKAVRLEDDSVDLIHAGRVTARRARRSRSARGEDGGPGKEHRQEPDTDTTGTGTSHPAHSVASGRGTARNAARRGCGCGSCAFPPTPPRSTAPLHRLSLPDPVCPKASSAANESPWIATWRASIRRAC